MCNHIHVKIVLTSPTAFFSKQKSGDHETTSTKVIKKQQNKNVSRSVPVFKSIASFAWLMFEGIQYDTALKMQHNIILNITSQFSELTYSKNLMTIKFQFTF